MGIYKPGRPFKYDPFTGTGSRPPSCPGEYRLRDESNNVAYLGEADNINRRMHEHMNSGKLRDGFTFEYKVADGRSTSVTRRQHEREKIAQHAPYLNLSSGGEGRIAKKR